MICDKRKLSWIDEKKFFGKLYYLVILLRIILTPIKLCVKVIKKIYDWTWD